MQFKPNLSLQLSLAAAEVTRILHLSNKKIKGHTFICLLNSNLPGDPVVKTNCLCQDRKDTFSKLLKIAGTETVYNSGRTQCNRKCQAKFLYL